MSRVLSLASALLAAAAQSAPGVAPLWCGSSDTAQAASFAGVAPTHALGQPATDAFAVAFSGLYLYGKGLLGIELISTLSAVCLSNIASVPANASASPPQGAAFVAAVSSPHAPTASARGCLLVTLSPMDGSGAWPTASPVRIDYWLRPATPTGGCATTATRAPDFTVRNANVTATGAVGAQAVARNISQCPASPVPPTLTGYALAPPAIDAITNASALEGFVPGGFVAALLGGLLTTTRCAYSAVPISSYPYALAYEVVFGSAQSGFAESCGWFARGPGLNLTYVLNQPAVPVPLNQSASICPQSWVPGQTRVLVDYFYVPPALPSAATSSNALSLATIIGVVAACVAFVALLVCVLLAWQRGRARTVAAPPPGASSGSASYLRLRLGPV